MLVGTLAATPTATPNTTAMASVVMRWPITSANVTPKPNIIGMITRFMTRSLSSWLMAGSW